MSLAVSYVQRFWEWQWRIHWKSKDIVSLFFSSSKDSSIKGKSPQDSKPDASSPGHTSPTEDEEEKPHASYSLRNKIGLIIGPLALLILLILPPSAGMYNIAAKMTLKSADAVLLQEGAAINLLTVDKDGKLQEIPNTEKFLEWAKTKAPDVHSATMKKAKAMKNCLAVLILMVVWWICESLPWGVTGLIPAALFPLLGVANASDASAPYGHKVVILFIAAFFLAQAMLKWNFHSRVALFIVDKIGSSPKRIVLGFMLASGFISMWMSNTATAMMMMPMGLAIVLHTSEMGKRMQKKGMYPGVDFTPGAYVFGSCLMIGIGYACNSGGMGTLIGTPPNLIYAGQLEILFPGAPPTDFASWLLFGFPLCLITTLALWVILVFFLRRPEIKEIPGGSELIKEKQRELGPWSKGEKAVGIILLITALAWIFQDEKQMGGITIYGLSNIFPWIDDSTVAVFMAILLFMVPINLKKNEFVLTWDWAIKIPWGLILLFGGGFSLAAGIGDTGAATWIGYQLSGLLHWPLIGLMFATAFVVALVSTVATNTAVATIFVPILGKMATAAHFDPRFLMILGCLAAQCAYALPVAAAPFAVCFGSGCIRMTDFVKVGIVSSIVAIIIAVLGSLLLLGPAFGVSPHVVPPWAIGL
jgi:sodium-dependent dicarboxylate transporter 2/3/5